MQLYIQPPLVRSSTTPETVAPNTCSTLCLFNLLLARIWTQIGTPQPLERSGDPAAAGFVLLQAIGKHRELQQIAQGMATTHLWINSCRQVISHDGQLSKFRGSSGFYHDLVKGTCRRTGMHPVMFQNLIIWCCTITQLSTPDFKYEVNGSSAGW